MELEGGCACGASRYRLMADPLIVHACHCRDCQRLTVVPLCLTSGSRKNSWKRPPLFRSLSSSLLAAESIKRCFSATSVALICGANITLHRAIHCSFAWERSIIRRRSNRMFTSSRGANCRGLISRKTSQHSKRFIISRMFGQSRAKSACVAT